MIEPSRFRDFQRDDGTRVTVEYLSTGEVRSVFAIAHDVVLTNAEYARLRAWLDVKLILERADVDD